MFYSIFWSESSHGIKKFSGINSLFLLDRDLRIFKYVFFGMMFDMIYEFSEGKIDR